MVALQVKGLDVAVEQNLLGKQEQAVRSEPTKLQSELGDALAIPGGGRRVEAREWVENA